MGLWAERGLSPSSRRDQAASVQRDAVGLRPDNPKGRHVSARRLLLAVVIVTMALMATAVVSTGAAVARLPSASSTWQDWTPVRLLCRSSILEDAYRRDPNVIGDGEITGFPEERTIFTRQAGDACQRKARGRLLLVEGLTFAAALGFVVTGRKRAGWLLVMTAVGAVAVVVVEARAPVGIVHERIEGVVPDKGSGSPRVLCYSSAWHEFTTTEAGFPKYVVEQYSVTPFPRVVLDHNRTEPRFAPLDSRVVALQENRFAAVKAACRAKAVRRLAVAGGIGGLVALIAFALLICVAWRSRSWFRQLLHAADAPFRPDTSGWAP